jgi:hypothetical protein
MLRPSSSKPSLPIDLPPGGLLAGWFEPIRLCTYKRLGVIGAALVMLWASGCGSGSQQPAQQNNPPPPPQRSGVFTHHNDNARTGANTAETTLTPANVNVQTFGRRATFPVEGAIYAQPLYVPKVTVGASGLHNLVLVATEHDQAYAFDPDSQQMMWHRDFLGPSGTVTPLSQEDVNYCDAISPEVGITGTPVIDESTLTMYVVVVTKEIENGQPVFHQRLHALDLSTGDDKTTAIDITDPGLPGIAPFDPLLNLQRSALLLAGGRVYVAWASFCDAYGAMPYQGWLMAFDSGTLKRAGSWPAAPFGAAGGIWMSGGGPAADSGGNIFVGVGNGATTAPFGGSDYGSSVVRLQWSPGDDLQVTDYFTAFDYQELNDMDLDLGTSSTVLLPLQSGEPHPRLLITASKDGTVYMLDRDNMGHFHQGNDSQVVQSFAGEIGSNFGSLAFWNDTLYAAGSGDYPKAFHYDPTSQQIDPIWRSAGSEFLYWPGATPTVSAAGNQNGILWLLLVAGWEGGEPAILQAFDATDLSKELYSSDMLPSRDQAGPAVKFTVPTVANGWVFVGASNELDLYGLLTKQ